MNINLKQVGKRFNADWVFDRVDFEFKTGQRYAITGPNGSGKSTLLQIIGGNIHHSRGSVTYTDGTETIPAEKAFKNISIAAPYLELVEEMTLHEFLQFHQTMKGLISEISLRDIAGLVSLTGAFHKQIRYYSSGMKQRVKLAQAIFSDTTVVLLDEPVTNLDEEGQRTYDQLIENYMLNRTLIVSSNNEREFYFCPQRIAIDDFK